MISLGKRIVGSKTLVRLDLLARRVTIPKTGKAPCNRHRRGCANASDRSGVAGTRKGYGREARDVASFAIPESVCHLSLHELPMTTRLAMLSAQSGSGLWVISTGATLLNCFNTSVWVEYD
jgi:hypothetical protein